MRMLINIGDGGHLKQPCVNCLLTREMQTNQTYGVKESSNHVNFYDYSVSQTVSARTVLSYSTKSFPEPLKEIVDGNDFEKFFAPGTLHTLLGLNQLFDHVFQHNRWIPDLFNRLRAGKLTDDEMHLIHQQKMIKIIFHTFVPIRTQDGLEKQWDGGQLKKVLSISQRILEIILEVFPTYKFIISFLQLLIAFHDMYNSMFGKSLQQNWDDYALLFLEKLKLFMSTSINLGMIQFHNIAHLINICAKYQVGAGCIGLDQSIEALHSHVSEKIVPNIKKTRKPASHEIFTDENPPSEGYINKFVDIHTLQLETALTPIKLKRNVLEHCEYLKTLEIDNTIIKQFDNQAHNHELLIKLSATQVKQIQSDLAE